MTAVLVVPEVQRRLFHRAAVIASTLGRRMTGNPSAALKGSSSLAVVGITTNVPAWFLGALRLPGVALAFHCRRAPGLAVRGSALFERVLLR
jgi:hypothetical protein